MATNGDRREGTRSNPVVMRYSCACGRWIEISLVATGNQQWGYWNVAYCRVCGTTAGHPALIEMLKQTNQIGEQHAEGHDRPTDS